MGELQRKHGEKIRDTAINALKAEPEGAWMEDMRGYLATVATVIATMTFQVGLNPPGGIVQNEEKGVVDCPKPNEKIDYHTQACPGDSVYAAARRNQYFVFMWFNGISFFTSLCVRLWLISGLPLSRRLPTLFLAMVLCISLLSLACTFVYGGSMSIPESNPNARALAGMSTLFFLVGFLGGLVITRFVFLCANICTKGSNASTTPSDDGTQVKRST